MGGRPTQTTDGIFIGVADVANSVLFGMPLWCHWWAWTGQMGGQAWQALTR